MSANPYDRMPRLDGAICVPGNLSAGLALARWREAGEPGDFWEWLAAEGRDSREPE